jgi:YbbR domain-containing protein
LKNKISIIIFSFLFSILIWGSVTLSEQFFSSADFKLKVVNQPAGYTTGILNPERISIKLKAKGWQLLTLYLTSPKEYFVSADNDSGVITTNLLDDIDENSWISSGITVTELNPRQVSFNVEKIKFKRLKVEAESDLTFSDGFGLATPVRVFPDSILVAGPSSLLDRISNIKTKVVQLSTLDNKTKIVAEIEEPTGFQLERNKVELTFDVQRIVEKSFDEVKVIINDVPDDRNVVLIPNTINCSLRGGINILGKINPNEISASINYRDIVYDTLGSLQPDIIIPNNTQLVFIKPVRLNYIIKKFE